MNKTIKYTLVLASIMGLGITFYVGMKSLSYISSLHEVVKNQERQIEELKDQGIRQVQPSSRPDYGSPYQPSGRPDYGSPYQPSGRPDYGSPYQPSINEWPLSDGRSREQELQRQLEHQRMDAQAEIRRVEEEARRQQQYDRMDAQAEIRRVEEEARRQQQYDRMNMQAEIRRAEDDARRQQQQYDRMNMQQADPYRPRW